MRPYLYLILLLLPHTVAAQQTELDQKTVYRKALTEYLRTHPGDVVISGSTRLLFVKEQPFTADLRDTIDGVIVQYLNLMQPAPTLGAWFPKKQKLTVLDMQSILPRGAVYTVWIMPMKTRWLTKEEDIKDPKYGGELCDYRFDYRVENGTVRYFYKEAVCMSQR